MLSSQKQYQVEIKIKKELLCWSLSVQEDQLHALGIQPLTDSLILLLFFLSKRKLKILFTRISVVI